MIWILQPDFKHYTRAHFKKLFLPKEEITLPVPLKRFPRKELVQVEIEKSSPVSDFFSCIELQIISERLADFFLENKTKVEIYPITVTHKNKKIDLDQDFYHLHTLCEVDCINQEESEIITKSGTHWGKLVLDESEVGQEKLFNIKGLFDVRAVTDDLKEKLIAEKFTGLELVPYDKFLKPYN
jgi:hypothetical protein